MFEYECEVLWSDGTIDMCWIIAEDEGKALINLHGCFPGAMNYRTILMQPAKDFVEIDDALVQAIFGDV